MQYSPIVLIGSVLPDSGSVILTSTFGIGLPIVFALSSTVSSVLVIDATGEHSVWPNTIVKSAPSSFSNLFTKAAGTVDPPEQTVLIADKSRDEKSGCSIMAISIAGTPNIAFEPYVSLNSKTNPGSNCSTRICVALFETAPRTHRTQPPV